MGIDLQTTLVSIAYIIAAILFILGLKGLSHPRTAVRGNLLGAIGMFIAIVVTLLDQRIIGFEVIIAGSVVGASIGAILAVKIKMTAMPQLVALFNGFGGGASVLVAGAALIETVLRTPDPLIQTTVATAASGLIGSVTLLGSLVAFGKLQGLISEKAVQFFGQKALIIVLGLVALFLGAWLVNDPAFIPAYWGLVAVASLLGVVLVIGIGGADMPVVISLLNSYSGLAAAATGFVLGNSVLIIAGSLVGTAGLILTNLMCKAMNRSLSNVLFGGVGATAITSPGQVEDDMYAGRVKSASADDVAMLLETARRVVVVPGYGMAVAQAQHAVRDLGNLLESKGVEVEFAIHPVAGRMPGHMNVLLAEADIAYDKLKEMDDINPTFDQTDVAIVIGANDVVNPVARDCNDPSNPIAGMPILDVDKAQAVVVIKRSLSPGFAGISNPLFAAENTLMLFGDGKKMVLELISALG
ncbi:NAD(P)(+) transhydrogenase (Re/Si-specific) subunit beta [Candidatus Bipolaricaulota bacterium]|nr:NAD(P)(+) transhydrogenase (Re/Si-specific) subunit beta [Candidatus Bipolaricaulota bacterium]